MTSEMNPYQAPASPAHEPPAASSGPTRRIRIRLIPVVACAALGSLIVLAAVLQAGVMVWLFHREESAPDYASGPTAERFAPTPLNLASDLVMFLVGMGWLLAAQDWLHGRWRRAALATFGLYALGAAFFFWSGH